MRCTLWIVTPSNVSPALASSVHVASLEVAVAASGSPVAKSVVCSIGANGPDPLQMPAAKTPIAMMPTVLTAARRRRC